MSFLEFIRTIFAKSDNQRLENFIVSHNPQTEGEVEALTRKYYRTQTMQWFNNC